MRAVRSLLHPDDLARLIERDYGLPAPVTVTLLRVGFNDTYAVTDARGGRWALRIYLREKYWIRSDADIRCELELLDHLARAGSSVAPPRRRCDGDLLGHLDAPEGERCFVLFAFSPGRLASDETLDPKRGAAIGSRRAIARNFCALQKPRRPTGDGASNFSSSGGTLLELPQTRITFSRQMAVATKACVESAPWGS